LDDEEAVRRGRGGASKEKQRRGKARGKQRLPQTKGLALPADRFESIAEVMEIGDDDGGEQTIDSEVVPAASQEPVAEPLEGNKAGEKGEGGAEQAGKCGGGERGGSPDALSADEAPDFARDNRGSDGDGEGETERFRAHFGNAGKHSCGDCSSGAGKPTKRKAEPLNSADDAGLPGAYLLDGGGGGRRGAMLRDSGNEYQDARGSESRRDDFQVAEEVFDLSLGGGGEHSLLDELHQGEADDPRKTSGEDDLNGELFERGDAVEKGSAPVSPEIDDDGEHGARVEHDEEQSHGGRGGVEAEQFFRDDDVSGTGDREKFGETLDDREYCDF